MQGDDGRRLERIEAQMDEVLVRVERIDGRTQRLEEGYAAVAAEVGGVEVLGARGERKSLRDRLHTLEDEGDTAKLGLQLLEEHKRRARARWTLAQKVWLFTFAAGGFVISGLRLLGIGG